MAGVGIILGAGIYVLIEEASAESGGLVWPAPHRRAAADLTKHPERPGADRV